MSKKQDDANQKAFERGQADWRNGKDLNRDNPYPLDSTYHHFWEQGWEAEDSIQKD
jgi:hypothetical protein